MKISSFDESLSDISQRIIGTKAIRTSTNQISDRRTIRGATSLFNIDSNEIVVLPGRTGSFRSLVETVTSFERPYMCACTSQCRKDTLHFMPDFFTTLRSWQDKLCVHDERTGASGSAEPRHVASGRDVVVTPSVPGCR